MEIKAIEVYSENGGGDADFNLVEIRDGTPHCRKHGAMNKFPNQNIWRCVSTYRYIKDIKGQKHFKENDCLAGCIEVNDKLLKGVK